MKISIISILSAFLLSLATSQRVIETDSSLILVPGPKSGPPVILIGLNGAFCDPCVYLGLFQTLQNTSNYTLWAALPKFSGNLPSHLEKAIPNTLNELKEHGAPASEAFIVGHSLGSMLGQDFLAKNSTGIKGFVVLGKFIKFEYQDPQVNFPVPVLQISGELDGLTKVSRLAMSFNQMLRHPQGKGHLHFPVTIIPGAYHSSYITGDIPAQINASDLKPEVSNAITCQYCAKLIDAFVDAQLNLETAETNPGAKYLFDYVYGYTYELMKPLLDAFALEGNSYLYNTSVVGSTKWVLDNIYDEMNLTSMTLATNITVQEHEWYKFLWDQPSATFENGILSHQVYTHKLIGTVESDDMSNIPFQSAEWIAVKYKSANYVYKAAGIQANATEISCKLLNQRAIEQVLATIPSKNKERYEKYGVKLVAGDDIDYWTRATWHAAGLKKEDKGDYVVVSSPRVYSTLNSWWSPGDLYCKLLSPARVAEWIYVDSLRKYGGASVKNTNLIQ